MENGITKQEAMDLLVQSPEILDMVICEMKKQQKEMEQEHERIWRLYNVKINSLNRAIKELENFRGTCL